jgi:hypothetical protein
MTSSKHPHDGTASDVPPLNDDLARDPGINGSKGNFARSDADPSLIKGDNTVEGDQMNNTTSGGGVSPSEPRTNK